MQKSAELAFHPPPPRPAVAKNHVNPDNKQNWPGRERGQKNNQADDNKDNAPSFFHILSQTTGLER